MDPNLISFLSETSISTSLALQGGKTGARATKAFKSYLAGGIYSPVFWTNVFSSGFSGASLCSSATGKFFPSLAPMCYGISVGCSCVADTLDGSMSISSLILVFKDKRGDSPV